MRTVTVARPDLLKVRPPTCVWFEAFSLTLKTTYTSMLLLLAPGLIWERGRVPTGHTNTGMSKLRFQHQHGTKLNLYPDMTCPSRYLRGCTVKYRQGHQQDQPGYSISGICWVMMKLARCFIP